ATATWHCRSDPAGCGIATITCSTTCCAASGSSSTWSSHHSSPKEAPMSRLRMRTRTHITTTEQQAAGSPGTAADIPQLLRLLHLASPALPIGAFHFSQGLEYAVEAGIVRDEASAFEWIDGIAGSGLAMLDLPVLHRLHAAWMASDHEAVL